MCGFMHTNGPSRFFIVKHNISKILSSAWRRQALGIAQDDPPPAKKIA
jgi:hypothetical protein